MGRFYRFLRVDVREGWNMKAFKHVVRLTVLLAVCMLMVACPEPASDLGGGGSEFDIFLGFSQDMGAASRSTINDDTTVDVVYARMYNSSDVLLPTIADPDHGVTALTQDESTGKWSATVRLASPASGRSESKYGLKTVRETINMQDGQRILSPRALPSPYPHMQSLHMHYVIQARRVDWYFMTRAITSEDGGIWRQLRLTSCWARMIISISLGIIEPHRVERRPR